MTRHTIRSPGARGEARIPSLSARMNKPHRKQAHALPVLERLLHGGETFSKTGTWGRRQVAQRTDLVRGPSEMGGRMKLAGAEVVGFSAPESGGWVGLDFRGRAGVVWSWVARGLRPEPVAANSHTKKIQREKHRVSARMENNNSFEAKSTGSGTTRWSGMKEHCGEYIHEIQFLCVVKLALGGPVRESNMGISTRRRAAHDAIDTAHTSRFRCHR